MVIVDKWDENYELVGAKIRSVTGREREKFSKMFNFQQQLYFALAQVKRVAMLNSISGDARRHLKDLNMYYRRQRRPDSDVQDTPAYSDERWSLGMNNSNAKSRTFRVLMPLGNVLDIIDHADIKHFLDKEGVRCHWKCIDARWDYVCNIRRSDLIEVD